MLTHEISRGAEYPFLVNEQVVATLVVVNFFLSFLGVAIGLWLVIEFASFRGQLGGASTEEKSTETEVTNITSSQPTRTSSISSLTRRNTPNSNVATSTGLTGVAAPGHEGVALAMAHRSAPYPPSVTFDNTTQGNVEERVEGSSVSASTTLTDFKALLNTQTSVTMEEPNQSRLTISAEPRRNRAVASSWPKMQGEVETQDTTTEVEMSVAPEAEAGPLTLNRSNPLQTEAEVPVGSEMDADEPPSPVNVLALSTDFPTARFQALKKLKATYPPLSDTKLTPSPLSPALDSTNADTNTADISSSLTNAIASSSKDVSSNRRVVMNADEPQSRSVPVSFPTSTPSENSGATATPSNLDLSAKTPSLLSQSQPGAGMGLKPSNPIESSNVGSSDSDTVTISTSILGKSVSAPSIATGGGSPLLASSSSSLQTPAATTSTVRSPVLVPLTSTIDGGDNMETRKEKGKGKERETDSESSSSSTPSSATIPAKSQATLTPTAVSKPERASIPTPASTATKAFITVDDVPATASTSIPGQESDSREHDSKSPQSSSSSSFGSNGSSSLISPSTSTSIQNQDKGKGKQCELPEQSTLYSGAFTFKCLGKVPMGLVGVTREDATGPSGSSIPPSSVHPPFPTAALAAALRTTRTRPDRTKSINVAAKPSRNPNSGVSTPQLTTATTPASVNVASNPNTTTNSNPTASSSTFAEVWRTIDWSKLSAPNPRVSNSDAFDFASPPPGFHRRTTFHPFPELTAPVSFGPTHTTLSTLASFRDACWHWNGQGFEPRPATAEGLEAGSTEGGGVDSGTGKRSGGSTSTLSSGSSVTVGPGEVRATGSGTTDGIREPTPLSSITSSNPGAEDGSGGIMVGPGAGGEH
ncbi:hypothetical protein PM082_023895 [Marasmius tenuissimus]|nr:hypothetical protein PM082_023895 [Marasmius tenuissimus]